METEGKMESLLVLGSARVWHGDRTWVTQKGQDMGNTFSVACGVFFGHAVENSFIAQGAPAADRRSAGTSLHRRKSLRSVWGQLQNRLQMVKAIPSVWAVRLTGPIAETSALAGPISGPLDQGYRSHAPRPTTLGRQKNSPAPAPNTSPPTSANTAYHSTLAATAGFGAPAQKTCSPRPGTPASGADSGPLCQSRVDGGFQRLVSHGRWRAPGAFDGARFVQPLRVVPAAVAQSGRSAGSPRHDEGFCSPRFAQGHSCGQWFAFRRHRSAGLIPSFGVVVAPGHPGRVHPSGTAGRQRGARTISWLLPARSGGGERSRTPSHAAPFQPLAGALQSGASARSAGWSYPGADLSPQPQGFSQRIAAIGLSNTMGGATCAQSRAHQMAWALAFRWPRIRRPNCRIESTGLNHARRLFGQPADWTHAPTGPRRNASSPLETQPRPIENVTYVLSPSCHPCPVPVPPACRPSRLGEDFNH